jgi:lysozyme family protein
MPASSYDEALRRLLAHEGGYSNHPSDPGGPTNFGITIADYRRYVKPNATAADVKGMNVAEAKAIYRAKYWNTLRCDDIAPGLDYAVFDYGVNSGPARVVKVLQRLVGRQDPASAIDQATLGLLRARDAKALIAAVCDERLAFLRRLKTWPVFGTGWARRVAEVRAAALASAGRQNAMPRARTLGDARDPAPAPPAPAGKGVAPVNTAAQKGTAGGVIVTGGTAAQQAHEAGYAPEVVIAIALSTIALGLGAWLFWRWRQRRLQDAVVAIEPVPAAADARTAPATPPG